MLEATVHDILGALNIDTLKLLSGAPNPSHCRRVKDDIHVPAGVSHAQGIANVLPPHFNADLFQFGVASPSQATDAIAAREELLGDVAA